VPPGVTTSIEKPAVFAASATALVSA